MRVLVIIFTLWMVLVSGLAFAQKRPPLPHGSVYGLKPNTMGPVSAAQLETRMDRQTRITTAVRGRVIRVTQPKGGWFEMDAGQGRIIAAHFKNYGINLPKALAGRIVIMDGVAQKPISPNDKIAGKKTTTPKKPLIFEVRGLMVDE
ncbi:DUF4920 domain-containing protein [Mucilaginibacter psychrotolerans]|uniref:DUF4920 domain-containing protein n=1 Tax=Mucilaginibacter psychrotolerans TaxID=1524096 RepID=A0A4Y8S415_9SPHI|nr:DUF4920 domain-containing protein [Mucilaginibacter psychrotolerans]TFF33310.1 DUF4920 domain-containing protein [Mucilaginibacter psychrotolerans]